MTECDLKHYLKCPRLWPIPKMAKITKTNILIQVETSGHNDQHHSIYKKKANAYIFLANNWTISNIYNIFLIHISVSFEIRILEKDTKRSMSLFNEFFL